MNSDAFHNESARLSILAGVNTLAEAAKVTLGPGGRNVAIERAFSGPSLTRDGVAVATDVERRARLEAEGATIVRDAAAGTVEQAAGGGTMTTVLTQSLVEEASRMQKVVRDPAALMDGIDSAVAAVVAELGKLSQTPTEEQTAALTARYESAGETNADPLAASGSALDEGIVPGGGVALLRAGADVQATDPSKTAQHLGCYIVRKAVEAPLEQIAKNAGDTPWVVVSKVKSGTGSYGYDAATREYGDLIERSIIDPTKVVRTALEKAAEATRKLLILASDSTKSAV
ncbi:TCP-1/cpn60 chaperonin family protein [Streptomyces sp. NPDC054871]